MLNQELTVYVIAGYSRDDQEFFWTGCGLLHWSCEESDALAFATEEAAEAKLQTIKRDGNDTPFNSRYPLKLRVLSC